MFTLPKNCLHFQKNVHTSEKLFTLPKNCLNFQRKSSTWSVPQERNPPFPTACSWFSLLSMRTMLYCILHYCCRELHGCKASCILLHARTAYQPMGGSQGGICHKPPVATHSLGGKKTCCLSVCQNVHNVMSRRAADPLCTTHIVHRPFIVQCADKWCLGGGERG